MSIDLSNKTFRLDENAEGHAATSTLMTFNDKVQPYCAEYSGPNIIYGQALIFSTEKKSMMLYHQLSIDQQLLAGKAIVSCSTRENNTIQLELAWKWLTPNTNVQSGISVWHEVT